MVRSEKKFRNLIKLILKPNSGMVLKCTLIIYI